LKKSGSPDILTDADEYYSGSKDCGPTYPRCEKHAMALEKCVCIMGKKAQICDPDENCEWDGCENFARG